MKDFLGNELSVGDKVVYINCPDQWLPNFATATIIEIATYDGAQRDFGVVRIEEKEKAIPIFTKYDRASGLIKIP